MSGREEEMPPRWASPKDLMKGEHEGQVRKTRIRRHGVLNHGNEQSLEETFKEQEEP